MISKFLKTAWPPNRRRRHVSRTGRFAALATTGRIVSGASTGTPISDSSVRRRPGFSLAELVVSLVSSSLLLAGMMSALYLATRAADTNRTTVKTLDTGITAEDVAAELRGAVYFKRRSATSVTFTVADRNGDGIVETIQYSWSGIPGEPLQRSYNGGTAVDVAQDVHDFTLSYTVQANPTTTGRILLVVPDQDNLASVDATKKATIEAMGYTVIPITARRADAELDASVGIVDAVYVSETISSSDLNTKINDAAVGVVSEEGFLNDDFGLASTAGSSYDGTQIKITDNTHYITSPFSGGFLQITSVTEKLRQIDGTPAADLQALAEYAGSGPKPPSVAVIEAGGGLYGGGSAAGARIILPFGDNSFNFNNLTADGLTLVQRAIQWAARAYVVTSAEITLQIGSDPAAKMETSTEIVSKPRA